MSIPFSSPLPSYFAIPAHDLAARSPIPLAVLPDSDALHAHFAAQVADEIRAANLESRPTRLILPVGPVRQYPLLADLCNAQGLSWRSVHIFLMDEYCDWQGRRIPAGHPLSFAGFFQRELVQRLDPALRPPPEQIHVPNPRRLDDVTDAIAALSGIDTCYGGIGIRGHVAFNEPPHWPWARIPAAEFRASGPRLLALNPETVVMNAARSAGGFLPALPPMAVTLGMAQIAGARRIRLYCQGGAWQRAILRVALFGAPGPAGDETAATGEDVAYPVTLLRGHPDLAIATDLETAQPVELLMRA